MTVEKYFNLKIPFIGVTKEAIHLYCTLHYFLLVKRRRFSILLILNIHYIHIFISIYYTLG